MDAMERHFWGTIHKSQKKASLLCDKIQHSILLYVYPFLCCFISWSAASHEQIVADNFFSQAKTRISICKLIQVASKQHIIKVFFLCHVQMFHFLRPKNKFNRLSLTTNMQSTFCSTDMTFVVGVYFQSLAMSHFRRARFRQISAFRFVYRQLYLSPLFLPSMTFKISLILVSAVWQGKNCACQNRGSVAETTFWHWLIQPVYIVCIIIYNVLICNMDLIYEFYLQSS